MEMSDFKTGIAVFCTGKLTERLVVLSAQGYGDIRTGHLCQKGLEYYRCLKA